MSTLADWQKQDWTHIWINGTLLENVFSEVTGVPYQRLTEINGAASTEAKSVTDRGSAPGTWTITLRISNDVPNFKQVYAEIFRQVEQKPIDIWHSVTDIFNITKLYVNSVRASLEIPFFVLTLDCVEYSTKPTKKTTQKSTGVSAAKQKDVIAKNNPPAESSKLLADSLSPIVGAPRSFANLLQ